MVFPSAFLPSNCVIEDLDYPFERNLALDANLLAQQIKLVSQAITRSSFAVLGFCEFCDLERLRRERLCD
jgi:hypothetical protein